MPLLLDNIEDQNNKPTVTTPVMEDLDSDDKKLFSLDGFQHRVSIAKFQLKDEAQANDNSTISSYDNTNNMLKHDSDHDEAFYDLFKHRVSVARNMIDSPTRSTRSKVSTTRSEETPVDNIVIDHNKQNHGTPKSYETQLVSTCSSERIKNARQALLGTTDSSESVSFNLVLYYYIFFHARNLYNF